MAESQRRRRALLIGVERYLNLPALPYVENDVRLLLKALLDIGYAKADVAALLSARATKTAIDVEIEKLADDADEDDEVLLYLSGHGFAERERNYFMPVDVMPGKWERTSVSISETLKAMRRSASKRQILLIDACNSGIESGGLRSPQLGMTRTEFVEFLRESEHRVVLSSCAADEKSYPSPALKNGIWTHYLAKALSGEAQEALESSTLLTLASLQNYLAVNVPETVRSLNRHFKQTPQAFVEKQTRAVLIADLGPLLARRLPAVEESQTVASATLRHLRSVQIQRLSGFDKRKGHFVPPRHLDAANEFVATAASSEIEDDVESVFKDLRNVMKYRFSQLEKSEGMICTPDFDYIVHAYQDPEDPAGAIIERSVSNIRTPSIIADSRFDSVFASVFTEIAFATPRTVDVARLINWIEESEPVGIELLGEDPDAEWCEVQIDGSPAIVRVSAREIAVIAQASRRTPVQLTRELVETRKLLGSSGIAGLLASKPR